MKTPEGQDLIDTLQDNLVAYGYDTYTQAITKHSITEAELLAKIQDLRDKIVANSPDINGEELLNHIVNTDVFLYVIRTMGKVGR